MIRHTDDDHTPLLCVECWLSLIWTGKISPYWSLPCYEHNSKGASRLCRQKVQSEFHSLGLSWPGFWLDQKSWKQSICLLSLAKQRLVSFLSSEKILVSPEWNFSERQKTDNDEAFLFSCCKIIKVLLRSHNLVLEGYFISSLLWQRNPHFETPEKNLEKKSSLCWCRWQGWKSWTRWEVTVHEFPLQGGGPAGHKHSDHIGRSL